MAPKKKAKRQSQADRLANLEEQMGLLLQKLNGDEKHGETNTEQHREATGVASPADGADARTGNGGTPQREARSRSRLSNSPCNEKSYTPRNQARARTSTPHTTRHSPLRNRSYSPARRQQVELSILSTAEALDSPAAKAKAQQIIDLLNPKLPGNLFDPYANRTARYPMPRLFLKAPAQKLVCQYKFQDDLTLPQFLEGYMRMFKGERDQKVKSHMVAHLIDIAELLQDFSWETVREWSNSILSSIGQGEFGWDDHLKIEKEKMIRIMGASGALSAGGRKDRNACLQFNAMKCQEAESHGALNMHICSFCLVAYNAEHEHPVLVCQKKNSYKRHRGRGGQSGSEGFEKQDQNYQGRYGEAQQNQAGRGRSFYNRDSYNKPQFQPRIENRYWNYPPPSDSKNQAPQV